MSGGRVPGMAQHAWHCDRILLGSAPLCAGEMLHALDVERPCSRAGPWPWNCSGDRGLRPRCGQKDVKRRESQAGLRGAQFLTVDSVSNRHEGRAAQASGLWYFREGGSRIGYMVRHSVSVGVCELGRGREWMVGTDLPGSTCCIKCVRKMELLNLVITDRGIRDVGA
jgi:hypothetical protein